MRISFVVLFMSVVFLSCKNKHVTNEDSILDTTSLKHHEVHWCYDGACGPANWAELVENCDCADSMQSPIDITASVKDEALKELKLNYKENNQITLINNGHTIQATIQEGNTLILNDSIYELKQFHFHAGSEHTINSQRYPLEVHLVHLSKSGAKAVIGVMIEQGAMNFFMYQIISSFPSNYPKDTTFSFNYDVTKMLPSEKGYYYYKGSLTTPPCTEGVNWFVMKKAITFSEYQIEKIKMLMPKNNYRPVQAINGREIKEF